jgi:molybdopterin-guanine dinucleotide biosynthesis protein A
MSDQTLTGAILAGGQARRYGGQDKSRLVVPGDHDGRTIIVCQRDLLQRVAAHTYIVTTTADRLARPDRFADLDLPVVTDVVDHAGALGGVHAALTHAGTLAPQSDRVLVIACDLPFLTADLLRTLAELARTADGAWVQGRRGPEPLIACYRRAALPRISAALADGERRASALGQILTLNVLAPDALADFGDPERLIANINTPDEWRGVQ